MERVIEETAEFRVIEVTTEGWPDKPGSLRSTRVEWKVPQPDPEPTPDERIAALEEGVLVPAEDQSRHATLVGQADQALADLRLIANSSGTLTGAQLSNAVRLLARVTIALVRLVIRRLDGTD